MPTSLLEQWPTILRLARSVEPVSVLDVGAGYGKGGVLFREYVPSVRTVHAVEAHRPYIAAHRLGLYYDRVDGIRFEECHVDYLSKFDLVAMVDVIEHIEEGLAVPVLQCVARHLLVCTPCVFAQDWRPGLPETERHVSCWDPWMVEKVGFEAVDVVARYGGWVGLFRREGP